MTRRRTSVLGLLTTVSLTLVGTLGAVPTASATEGSSPGTRSLATVLAADKGFDHRADDFDIVDAAVGAVLTAKPTSAVAVLADGTTPVTAFLPNDRAFRRLAYDLTGTWYRSESRVFTTLAGALGVDTIEAVLLYHVVPGATVGYGAAVKSDGATLTTALEGATVEVNVFKGPYGFRRVALLDNDPDAPNGVVVAANINRGNLQIAHGVNRVLRPVDL
jgi:uncharacterized surface protein with fasciclin (FAS1) repeats